MEAINPVGREASEEEEQDSVLTKSCKCNGDPVFTAARIGIAECGCTDEGIIAVNVYRG